MKQKRTEAPRRRAPGAGRKPLPPEARVVKVAVALAPGQREALEALPGSLSHHVRAAVAQYLESQS